MNSIFILVLLLLATALLVSERLRADMVAMLILAALVLGRMLEPEQALSGFSNEATVAVACMFVLTAGLQGSGVVQFLADRLLLHGPSSPTSLMFLTALVVAPVSAFINNTAAVAVFLPIISRACQDRQISPSRMMMPLSFFAMLGGTCTLIGTSTNILVSSIAVQNGQPRFGMFEFSSIGLVLLVLGGAYLFVFSEKLIPERVKAESLTAGHHLNPYLSEVVVLEDSPLIGQDLREARLGERYDLEVLGHVRNKVMRGVPGGYDELRQDDILLVKAPASALVKLRDAAGIAVRPGRRPDDADLRSGDTSLYEAVIPPNSELDGRSLKGADFRGRFGATALAIRRHGEDIREKIGHIRLRMGDELLILAPQRRLPRLRQETSFLILQELDLPVIRPVSAITASLIVAGVIVVATLGIYDLAEAAVVGAVLMVLTGCVQARKVYSFIDWRVIFLLAGLLPLGIALESSGAADTAARWLVAAAGNWGNHAVLAVFFLLAAVLTGVMSNLATAALLAPLAITCANAVGSDPRPFLMAVTFAASAAFYTPIGYQTNLLVYGPGGYRFTDFLRLGTPLTLMYWIVGTLLIPVVFPFHP
ncbi:MAG: SLC13 family permease [bacterium]|nr:SLC13 family permease [bacterium]